MYILTSIVYNNSVVAVFVRNRPSYLAGCSLCNVWHFMRIDRKVGRNKYFCVAKKLYATTFECGMLQNQSHIIRCQSLYNNIGNALDCWEQHVHQIDGGARQIKDKSICNIHSHSHTSMYLYIDTIGICNVRRWSIWISIMTSFLL